MSLYGFPREPEATDVETTEPFVPPQRVTSAPVAIPSVPPEPTYDPDPPFTFAEQLGEFGVPAPEPAQPQSAFGGGYEPASHLNGGAASAPSTLASATANPKGAGTLTGAAGWQTSPGDSAWGHGSPVVASPGTFGAAPPATTAAPSVDRGESDEPVIPPWDRKPLMVVIASAAVLVVIAIISGLASAAIFLPNPPVAAWRDAGSQSSDPPTQTPPPAAPPAAAIETITMSGVGDVIMGSFNLGLPPNNGAGFFDPVKEALASDLVMGNLETPLSDPTGYSKCGEGPSDGCFQFSVPPSYANHLRDGGFQVLNLANNHTNDMGPQGLTNTRDALTAAGLQYTGGIDQITYVTVKGIKVAVLGFSVYSWAASLNDIPGAVELVRQADEAADLVVIQMQGGAEGSDKTHVRPGHEFFLGEDRGDLIAFSHAVIDAGADVIFGHGPHVMRGMEFYKGRLIAYSLGNFCGYRALGTAGYLGVGGVLKVTLKKDGSWVDGTLVSTEMVNGGLVAVDSDLRALPFVDGLSKADFGANAAVISTTDGTISPPV